MDHSNVIEIKDLCFAYDSTEVLHNITLSIEAGSYTFMVGPNGGGKTTLLKLILGLLKPVYGSIAVMGLPPEKARKQMGYVPQSMLYDPQFPISVQDAVLLGMIDQHICGPFTKADKTFAAETLEKVGLAGFGKRPFSSLSGGERQRVLVAQALASRPKLLLLDEPGANLDPQGRLNLYQLLGTLTPEITVLLVSHNLNVVSSVASHIICVNTTADSHRIEEVSSDALANGAWAHLTHDKCPVGSPDLASLHEPHHAMHIHN